MKHDELIQKLKTTWEQLTFQYTGDLSLIRSSFEELVSSYSEVTRYYHNLQHVWGLVQRIDRHKSHIQNLHALLFAAFYHDVVYEVSRSDNELQSAKLAEKILTGLAVDRQTVDLTVKIINQSATHKKTNHFDIDIFLDFDRCILAAPEEEYLLYKNQIRREYSIFTDTIYNFMRKKRLEQFLSIPEIYYTAICKVHEPKARQNMERELLELSGGGA